MPTDFFLWGLIAIQLVLLLTLTAIIIHVGLVLFGFRQWLPYVPTSRRVLRAIVDKGTFDASHTIVDLGCGTGTMLAVLHRAYPQARLIGVEYRRHLVWLARLRFHFSQNRPTIIHGDMFDYPLQSVNGIIGFWISDFTPRLAKKFVNECQSGTVIVSNLFSLPETPGLAQEPPLLCDKRDRVYHYITL